MQRLLTSVLCLMLVAGTARAEISLVPPDPHPPTPDTASTRAPLTADDPAGAHDADRAPLLLRLPLVDVPYTFAHGLRGPSMAQSLAVTEGYYEITHRAIQSLWRSNTIGATASLVFFNVLMVGLPGDVAWLHEEYHRAVMGNRGIASYNDVYKLNLFAETIAVSRVEDEDLVRLKAEHPAEQVRLGIAGIEGEHLLARQLQRNRFFGRSRANHIPLLWLTKLGSAMYVLSGHTSEAEELTEEMNARDGADIRVRDFTGHDFTAWVYDLHRPDEPYASRGVHPSGVGIDRYVKPSDLTAEELAYLRQQGKLQLVNFLDPHLLGFRGFTTRDPFTDSPVRWTVAAGHMLTSFGSSLNATLLADQEAWNVQLVLHRYANGARSFPGFDLTAYEYPIRLGGRRLHASPRVAVWLQPENQEFRTERSVPGSLVSLQLAQQGTSRWGTFAEVEAKTAGWVAGVVHLEPNISLRIGGSVALR